MRPIDADALEAKTKTIYMEFENVAVPSRVVGIADIHLAPTIDMQNVIRCTDCAYYGKSPFGHPTLGWCRIDGKHRGRNFFCGNADRKEEGNA